MDDADTQVAAFKAKKQQIVMQRAQEQRDEWIRKAYAKGRGMSTRRIATIVGLSFQRVAQIIRGE